MNVKDCPECLAEIPAQAVFCRHCAQRTEGKSCPECCTRCAEEARRCRWCGARFESAAPALDVEPFSIKGAMLATMLCRGRFLRQTLRVDGERVSISTPGVFGLTRRDEEIPWKRIAGFDYRSGLFWDAVQIETRGQNSTEFGCLTRSEGAHIREVLQRFATETDGD